jgi:hypothetical protein
MKNESPNNGAAANRRPDEQSDGSGNLSETPAADRVFPVAVAKLGRWATSMRTAIFTSITVALLLCGCAALPGRVPGQSRANASSRIVRLALKTIRASEFINDQGEQYFLVKDTQVLEKPDGYKLDPQTHTGIAKWVERWTIQRPTCIVTYRVTFDARGPEGLVVGAIQENSNGQPKIPIMEIHLK